MTDNLDVEAINLSRREAFLSDGTIIPIVKLYDGFGDETQSEADAVSFIARQHAESWFAGRIDGFCSAILN